MSAGMYLWGFCVGVWLGIVLHYIAPSSSEGTPAFWIFTGVMVTLGVIGLIAAIGADVTRGKGEKSE